MFSKKFHLLGSQTDNSENICWSSSTSDSSDSENPTHSAGKKITNKIFSKKRKRGRKASRNISNLDVTIIDPSSELASAVSLKKSPILTQKTAKTQTSPILMPSQKVFTRTFRRSQDISPLLNQNLRSPILTQKNSPISAVKTRKKLFQPEDICNNYLEVKRSSKNTLPELPYLVLNNNLAVRLTNKISNEHTTSEMNKTYKSTLKTIKQEERKTGQLSLSNNNLKSIKIENTDHNCEEDGKLVQKNNNIIKKQRNKAKDDLMIARNNKNSELAKSVLSFFDNQFSSDNSSQHSIVETQTPNDCDDKNVDEIEILSYSTQVRTKSTTLSPKLSESLSITVSINNCTDAENFGEGSSKKMKYKRDGLAYRLNALLKKQNASVSLWHHERYLEANASFVIPKEEHIVFRIRNVYLKYGCYLLQVIDRDDEIYFTLINRCFVHNCVFLEDSILKVYLPYRLVMHNHQKLLINVCKFECFAL